MSDDAPEDDASTPPAETEKPKRIKRRKRRDAEDAREKADAKDEKPAARDESDEQLPAFARSFPRDDDALTALLAAFEAGDYARVRREAPLLADKTERDDVRRAAREIRRRLDPDPLAVYMLMAAAALLVFLAGWYWLHPHSP
jgi:hypothetical protein